jgi:hypothetical protein
MVRSPLSAHRAQIIDLMLILGSVLVLAGLCDGFLAHGNPIAVYVLLGGGVAMFAGALLLQWTAPPGSVPDAAASAAAAASTAPPSVAEVPSGSLPPVPINPVDAPPRANEPVR